MSSTIFYKDESNQIISLSYQTLLEQMRTRSNLCLIGIEPPAYETRQHYLYISAFYESGIMVLRRYPLVKNRSGRYVCTNVYACLLAHANGSNVYFGELQQGSSTPNLSDEMSEQFFTTNEIDDIQNALEERVAAQQNQIFHDLYARETQSQQEFSRMEGRLSLIEQEIKSIQVLQRPAQGAPVSEPFYKNIRTCLRDASDYASGLVTSASEILSSVGFFSSSSSNNQTQRPEDLEEHDIFGLEPF